VTWSWSGLATCGLVLWAALPAGAQDAGPAGAEARGRERSLRDEVHEMVDAYVVMQIQERLGLTDEQLSRLLPLVRRQQKERRDLEQRRHRALGEMGRLLESGTAREERIAELLREIKAVEAELPSAVKRNQDAIDGLLSNVQQAKYRLLQAEVDHRLRELRRRVHERERDGREGADVGPRGRGAAPAAGVPGPRHP
jgi:hypothetical protein